MRKFLYISPDSFIDVDFPVIQKLNCFYHLLWLIVYPEKGPYKFEVDVIDQYCKKHDIVYSVIFAHGRARYPQRIISDLELLQKARKFKPDLIYIETFSDPWLPWLTRALLPVSGVIVAVHDANPHINQMKYFRKISDHFSVRLFRNFHLFSKTQEKLFNQTYPEKNSFVAPLYLKDFGKPQFFLKKNKKISFLFFGTIYFYKGLDILIKAVNFLSERTTDFTVIIAGNCNDFDQYRRLIKREDLFDLQIKMIPNNEIADLFAQTDYLVLPYRDVTQSGPLLIAYNYNVPVIASDLDGFKEYILNNETGFLFPTGNAVSLADLLYKIVNIQKDDHLRIRKNLSDFILDHINLDSIIDMYIKFFETIR